MFFFFADLFCQSFIWARFRVFVHASRKDEKGKTKGGASVRLWLLWSLLDSVASVFDFSFCGFWRSIWRLWFLALGCRSLCVGLVSDGLLLVVVFVGL